jgi:hypothetical protein
MLGFTPLTPVSAAEKRMLRQYASSLSATVVRSLYEKQFPKDASSAQQSAERRRDPLSPKELREAFSSGKEYNRRRLGFWKSRSAEEYLQDGIDVSGLAREAIRKTKGKARIMDLGAETAQMLMDLKKEFGDKIETHAVSPTDSPRFPVDHYHMVLGEFLPREFGGKFHLITSLAAFPYMLFPHLALKNVAQSLSRGGKAVISRRRHVASLLVPIEIIEEAGRYFSRQKLTKKGTELVKEELKKQGKSLSEADITMHLLCSGQHFDFNQDIAWVNALVEIGSSPKFAVRIINSRKSSSLVPELVEIERVR